MPPARLLTEENDTFHLQLSVTRGNDERGGERGGESLFAATHAAQKVQVARRR